jgi:hypothetical protein
MLQWIGAHWEIGIEPGQLASYFPRQFREIGWNSQFFEAMAIAAATANLFQAFSSAWSTTRRV